MNHLLTTFNFQLVRDDADVILGRVWADRLGQLRARGDKNVHTVLGDAYVRHLQRHQHRRPPEPPHRYDES